MIVVTPSKIRKYTTYVICTGCQRQSTLTGNYRGKGKATCYNCDMPFGYRLAYPEFHQSQLEN